MIDPQTGKFQNYYVDYLGRVNEYLKNINGNQVLTQGSLLTNGFSSGSAGVSVSADGSLQVNNNDPSNPLYGHHEDEFGNSYWGTSPDLWRQNINNAKAYILSNGNARFVNGYFTGTVTASTINGSVINGTVINGGELHVPDKNSTANSWHVDIYGNMWSGCTYNDFVANPENAYAYTSNNGFAFFRNTVEVRSGVSAAFKVTQFGTSSILTYLQMYAPGGVNDFRIENPSTGIYIKANTGYDITLDSDNLYTGILHAPTVKSGYLEPTNNPLPSNMGDSTHRWNKIFCTSIDIGGNGFTAQSITYVTGISIDFTAQTYNVSTATKTFLVV